MKVTAEDVRRVVELSPAMAKAIASLINEAAHYDFAKAVASAQVITNFAATETERIS